MASPKRRNREIIPLLPTIRVSLPSTNDVSSVTFAALRRPAGKFSPIFSNFSLNSRPPFLLFALQSKHDKVAENQLKFFGKSVPIGSTTQSTPTQKSRSP
jgi:hypothetical protein